MVGKVSTVGRPRWWNGRSKENDNAYSWSRNARHIPRRDLESTILCQVAGGKLLASSWAKFRWRCHNASWVWAEWAVTGRGCITHRNDICKRNAICIRKKARRPGYCVSSPNYSRAPRLAAAQSLAFVQFGLMCGLDMRSRAQMVESGLVAGDPLLSTADLRLTPTHTTSVWNLLIASSAPGGDSTLHAAIKLPSSDNTQRAKCATVRLDSVGRLGTGRETRA